MDICVRHFAAQARVVEESQVIYVAWGAGIQNFMTRASLVQCRIQRIV